MRQHVPRNRTPRRLVLPLAAALAATALGACSSSRSDKPASTLPGSLVFATTPNGQKADLKVLKGDRTDLVSTDGDPALADPVFSPYGADIVYLTDAHQVSVIKNDGGAGILITAKPGDQASWPSRPDWLPNGTVSYEAGGKLVVVQLDGTVVERIALTTPAGKAVAATGAYAWSPDGTSLVFDCGSDQKPAFCVRDLKTGKSRTLFEPRWRFTALDWSTDGSKILAGNGSGQQSAATPDVYVVNADGTGLKALTRTGDESNPVWSPDGTQVAFVSHGSTDDGIWVMGADGSGAKVVLSDKDAAHPDWVAK